MLLYPMARLVILISAVPRNLLGVQFQHQIPALVAAEILVWRNNLERSTNKKLYFFATIYIGSTNKSIGFFGTFYGTFNYLMIQIFQKLIDCVNICKRSVAAKLLFQ